MTAKARLSRIVVAGGGTAGWMTAAALGKLAGQVSITLVESDEIGTVGVGEATIPAIRDFNQALGLDEAEFVAATGATYKLGIGFEGWGAPGDAYVHAFGTVGRGIGILPFHHAWLRGRDLGLAKPLGHYLLNVIAIAGNRFAHFQPPADSVFPAMPYAFHFDAGLYARYLRGKAEAWGVVRKEGMIDGVERSDDGDIAALRLSDGTRIEGDLFIDCSGFRALLIEQELESGFEDWTEWLRCDRALAVPCASVDPLVPYTRSIARKAGWQWRIPLQHRIGNGHVFCSDAISEDEATAILMANLDGEPLAQPRALRFTTGKRRECWKRNVIAIGLSSGFIEPLESTSIHLIQTAITRLLDLLPSQSISQAERDEYNARTDFEMRSIRDFIILHYHANQRVGEPFWDGVRAMRVPDTLQHKIDLFRQSGRLMPDVNELFDARGWVQVLLGQNVVPESWHPAADAIAPERLADFLGKVERACVEAASRMGEHQEFIRQFAPVRIPEPTS
ncbi:MAG: tryptophan halogenase family protein [Sphingomicrobium sp.]